jgi:hypothetical protein
MAMRMGRAKVRNVNVATREQMEDIVLKYLARGYVVEERTEARTALLKRKQHNIVLLILCIPLVFTLGIYAMWYAQKRDKMVVIRITPASAAPPASATP